MGNGFILPRWTKPEREVYSQVDDSRVTDFYYVRQVGSDPTERERSLIDYFKCSFQQYLKIVKDIGKSRSKALRDLEILLVDKFNRQKMMMD